MTTFYQQKENISATVREQSLFSQLPEFIDFAKQHSSYYQGLLASFDANAVDSRAQLAKLPITRKSDLLRLYLPYT